MSKTASGKEEKGEHEVFLPLSLLPPSTPYILHTVFNTLHLPGSSKQLPLPLPLLDMTLDLL